MAKHISRLNRLTEYTKPENFGVDIKGFMSCKSAKIPIPGQPVESGIRDLVQFSL